MRIEEDFQQPTQYLGKCVQVSLAPTWQVVMVPPPPAEAPESLSVRNYPGVGAGGILYLDRLQAQWDLAS